MASITLLSAALIRRFTNRTLFLLWPDLLFMSGVLIDGLADNFWLLPLDTLLLIPSLLSVDSSSQLATFLWGPSPGNLLVRCWSTLSLWHGFIRRATYQKQRVINVQPPHLRVYGICALTLVFFVELGLGQRSKCTQGGTNRTGEICALQLVTLRRPHCRSLHLLHAQH